MSRIFRFLCGLAVLLGASVSWSQPDLLFQQHHDLGLGSSDSLAFSSPGPFRSVYIAGQTDWDGYVARVNQLGQKMWHRRLSFTTVQLYEKVCLLTTTQVGPLVVVYTQSMTAPEHYILIQFDSDGNQIFARHLNGTAQFSGGNEAVVNKPDGSFLFIRSVVSGPGSSVLIDRINSQGTTLYTRTVQLNAATANSPQWASQSSAGETYIGVSSNPHYLVKLSTSDTIEWQVPLTSNTLGLGCAAPDGTLYVTYPKNNDIEVKSYGASGSLRWTNQYSSQGARTDSPRSISIAGGGVRLVASTSGSSSRLLVMQVASDGTASWSQELDPNSGGTDLFTGSAQTSEQETVVSGTSTKSQSTAAILAKVSANGSIQFSRAYAGLVVPSSLLAPCDLGDSTVFAGGIFSKPGRVDLYAERFDTFGGQLSETSFNLSGGSNDLVRFISQVGADFICFGVSGDTLGGVVTKTILAPTGSIHEMSNGTLGGFSNVLGACPSGTDSWIVGRDNSSQFFLAKHNKQMQLLFQKFLGTGGFSATLCAYPDGGALTANTVTSGQFTDVVIRRFGSDGAVAWSYQYGIAADQDNVNSAIVDSNGNAFVTGTSLSGGPQRAWTIKLSPTGTPLWTIVNPLGSRSTSFVNLKLSPQGNLFEVGWALYGGTRQSVAASISPSGNVRFAQQFPIDGTSAEEARVCVVDSNEGLRVIGSVSNGARDHAYYAHLDAGGLLLYKDKVVTNNTSDDYAIDVAVNPNGNAAALFVNNDGFSKTHVILYNSTGNRVWGSNGAIQNGVAEHGADGHEQPLNVSFTPNGSVRVLGSGQYLIGGYDVSCFVFGETAGLPTKLEVTGGASSNPVLESLFDLDSDPLIVKCSPILSASSSSDPEFIVDGKSPTAAPGATRFELMARVSRSNLKLRIEFYDWNTGSYDPLTAVEFNASMSMSSFSLETTESRFIDPSTKTVRARVRVRPATVMQFFKWQAIFDKAAWTFPG